MVNETFGRARQAVSYLPGSHERHFAPVSRREIAARFLSATAGFGAGLIAKTGNERFRFDGDREQQILWRLVIRTFHKRPPSPRFTRVPQAQRSRRAVTGVIARESPIEGAPLSLCPRPSAARQHEREIGRALIGAEVAPSHQEAKHLTLPRIQLPGSRKKNTRIC